MTSTIETLKAKIEATREVLTWLLANERISREECMEMEARLNAAERHDLDDDCE